MVQQGVPSLRGLNPLALAMQQRRAEGRFHVADARARRGDSQMHTLGAMRDAARLDHMEKQPEIGQIESHGPSGTFEFREVRLRFIPIASSIGGSSDSGNTKAVPYGQGLSDRLPQ